MRRRGWLRWAVVLCAVTALVGHAATAGVVAGPAATRTDASGTQDDAETVATTAQLDRFKICERVETRDGNQTCINERDVFADETVSSAEGISAFVRLGNLEEEQTVRLEWVAEGLTYEFEKTLGPGETATYAPSVSLGDPPDEMSVTLYVDGDRKALKSVEFSARPEATFETKSESPLVNETVVFDATNSTDTDGDIDAYEWDLDGDGDIDRTGQQVNWTYTEGGSTPDVTLSVTDNAGLQANVSRTLYVNVPPAAMFDNSLSEVRENNEVTLDAGNSTDTDGSIERYEWDFGANGTTDATGATVTTVSGSGDTFDVTLVVTDDRGGQDTLTRTILVPVDSDDDGLVDRNEEDRGTDPTDPDTDGDGLRDGREIEVESNPLEPDTDDDGLDDGRELEVGSDPLNADTDDDGLDDGRELEIRTNPLEPDTDGDGLADGTEVDEYGTDPTVVDTDGDGLADGTEVDEYDTDPTVVDTDGDGLDDDRELEVETDPLDPDSDDDGLRDGEEVERGADPIVADTDSDGVADGAEVDRGIDPTDPDTDGDLFDDNIDPLPELTWIPIGGLQLLLTGIVSLIIVFRP